MSEILILSECISANNQYFSGAVAWGCQYYHNQYCLCHMECLLIVARLM